MAKKEEKLEEKASEKGVPNEKSSSNETIEELLRKNLRWSQILYEQNKSIKRRLTWTAVANYLRLALILVPLILAFIYLPSLIDQALSQYSDVLSGGAGGGLNVTDILSNFSADDLKEIVGQLK